MNRKELHACILKKFRFLETQYSANVKEMDNSVEYLGKDFCVAIMTNRGEIFVYVGRSDKSEFVELGQIVTYRLKLKSHGYGDTISGNFCDVVRQLALLIKEHCAEMLKGDFSSMPEIKKYSKDIGLDLGY